MATRSTRQLRGIRRSIDKLDSDAVKAAASVIERVGVDDADALSSALLDALSPVCRTAAQTAAQIAAAAYGEWRRIDTGERVSAIAVSSFSEGDFIAAVNTAAKAARDGAEPEQVLQVIKGRIGYNSRNAYSSTLFENARNDSRKPRLARVPEGSEACSFCMMLASRGFVYSGGREGEEAHNHDNCNCVYVASWDRSPKASGYDPDKWYSAWKESLEEKE